jgi:hypothetical protein
MFSVNGLKHGYLYCHLLSVSLCERLRTSEGTGIEKKKKFWVNRIVCFPMTGQGLHGK